MSSIRVRESRGREARVANEEYASSAGVPSIRSMRLRIARKGLSKLKSFPAPLPCPASRDKDNTFPHETRKGSAVGPSSATRAGTPSDSQRRIFERSPHHRREEAGKPFELRRICRGRSKRVHLPKRALATSPASQPGGAPFATGSPSPLHA